MYTNNARISHRQMFRQMLVALLGVYMLYIPILPRVSGRQGILSLLAAGGIYLLFSIYFIRIKYVFLAPEKYMGKTGSRIFTIVYLSWLWVTGVALLLLITRITERFFIEDSVPWLILLLAGVSSYLGSYQGLERRGRMGEVCFPVFLAILGGMLFLAVPKMRLEYLTEMGELSLPGLAEGTYEVWCAFLPLMYLPIAIGNVEKPQESRRIIKNAVLLLAGFLSLGILLLQGSFGLGGYEHKKYPLFDLMSGIRLPGDFLGRIDIFWIAAVVFSLLFGLGSVFFYNHEILVRIKMEKTAVFFAAGIIFAAEVCERKEVSLEFFHKLTVNIYGPLFLLLMLWAAAAGKRRKKKAVCACALSLLLLLTGCGVSLEDRVFPMSMSVDYAEGRYQIIYGIPELSKVTGQNKSDTEGSKEQAVLYEGKTPQQAEENFRQNQEKFLDMGHIKALILGNKILENQERLGELLLFLEDNPSIAGNIYLFSCKDIVELMSIEGTDSVGDYLTGILENNPKQNKETAVTLQDFYNAWHRKEDIPEIPEVVIVNKRPYLR